MIVRHAGFVTLFLILILNGISHSQYPPEVDESFSVYLKNDTDASSHELGSYYVDQDVDSVKAPNPTIALLKSIAVPGWGQISNGKYIKAGIVIALETTLIGTYIHYWNKTEDARDTFENAALDDKSRLYREFDDAKDQRNRFAWFCATTIFVSMFDAYVDAHLANFPRSKETLSFNIAPTPDEAIRVSLAYNF
jgi:uncharacterized protein DUF5683